MIKYVLDNVQAKLYRQSGKSDEIALFLVFPTMCSWHLHAKSKSFHFELSNISVKMGSWSANSIYTSNRKFLCFYQNICCVYSKETPLIQKKIISKLMWVIFFSICFDFEWISSYLDSCTIFGFPL